MDAPKPTTLDRGVAPPGYFARFYSDRDWRFYNWILSQAIRFSEPGPMLDIGAGAGFLVEAAQRWGLDAEGVEGSAEGLEAAWARYPEARLRWHLLSEPLPYTDAAFQTVFMNQVIEHLEPPVGRFALAEAHRVLRRGGMLFLASPSRFNKEEVAADPTHLIVYTPKELGALLASVGFERIAPFNAPLSLLGRGQIGSKLMALGFRVIPWQRLSATANYIAFKA